MMKRTKWTDTERELELHYTDKESKAEKTVIFGLYMKGEPTKEHIRILHDKGHELQRLLEKFEV